MKFTIALYGSFKDSAGYAWKLPAGYDGTVFEKITARFSTRYEDGRNLRSDELYGGYFIDVLNDRFIAFRFIDGGEDSLGREGVVVINWAAAAYSGLVGKNLRPLFERLTMLQMPAEECMEVDFPEEFTFGGSAESSMLGTERVITGEDAESVLRLPAEECCRDTLVQFALKEQKEASVKFLSPKRVRRDMKHPSSGHQPTGGGNGKWRRRLLLGTGLVAVCLIACLWLSSSRGLGDGDGFESRVINFAGGEFRVEKTKLLLRLFDGVIFKKDGNGYLILGEDKKGGPRWKFWEKHFRKRGRVDIRDNEVLIRFEKDSAPSNRESPVKSKVGHNLKEKKSDE